MTQPPPPEEHPASTDTEAPPPKRHSEAILPFGVGERLDEVAQNRFSRTDWIELAAAVLLALATIVAAWSAYEATRWSGVQAKATRSAIEARSAAGQQTTIYGSVVQIDVQSWITWLQQRATGNDSGAAFMQERFREEFRPAFDAWLALVPAGAIRPGRLRPAGVRRQRRWRLIGSTPRPKRMPKNRLPPTRLVTTSCSPR